MRILGVILVIDLLSGYVSYSTNVYGLVLNTLLIFPIIFLFKHYLWAKKVLIGIYVLEIVSNLIIIFIFPQQFYLELLQIVLASFVIGLLVGEGSKKKAIFFGIIPFFILTPGILILTFMSMTKGMESFVKDFDKQGDIFYQSDILKYNLIVPEDWRILKKEQYSNLSIIKMFPKELVEKWEVLLIQKMESQKITMCAVSPIFFTKKFTYDDYKNEIIRNIKLEAAKILKEESLQINKHDVNQIVAKNTYGQRVVIIYSHVMYKDFCIEFMLFTQREDWDSVKKDIDSVIKDMVWDTESLKL